MDCSTTIWAVSEFKDIDLGDIRRNKRFVSVVSQMAQQPEYSLCRANSSWKNIKAAYRVLNSDKVSQNNILEPHIQRTVDRCSEEKILLAIQDTSYLNYTKRERTEGLGFIGLPRKENFSAKGLIMHTTFAVSTAGDPLGILNQEIWARTSQRHHVTKTQRSQNRRLPIEKKRVTNGFILFTKFLFYLFQMKN